jgi:hypothetical protein
MAYEQPRFAALDSASPRITPSREAASKSRHVPENGAFPSRFNLENRKEHGLNVPRLKPL